VLKKSIELIEKFSGRKPRGYVAPWWEMSAVTAELLLQNEFGTITAKLRSNCNPEAPA
jgi:peptidoglycan-N-acetylglucosamine deacetylase